MLPTFRIFLFIGFFFSLSLMGTKAWGQINTPAPQSSIKAITLAVSNLDSTSTFYKTALQMLTHAIKSRGRNRKNPNSVKLVALNGMGSAIILRASNTTQANPGKLVFYSDDVATLANTIYFSGGQILLPPTPQPQFGGALVGFARDPEGNLLEMVEVPTANRTYLSAVGIGVSDLEQSLIFYRDILGFAVQTYLEIPGQYNEYIFFPGAENRSALVLMHWTNGSERQYGKNPLALQIQTNALFQPSYFFRFFRYFQNKSTRNPLSGLTDPDGMHIQLNPIKPSHTQKEY